MRKSCGEVGERGGVGEFHGTIGSVEFEAEERGDIEGGDATNEEDQDFRGQDPALDAGSHGKH